MILFFLASEPRTREGVQPRRNSILPRVCNRVIQVHRGCRFSLGDTRYPWGRGEGRLLWKGFVPWVRASPSSSASRPRGLSAQSSAPLILIVD